jgi:nucleoid DNA-binding protein
MKISDRIISKISEAHGVDKRVVSDIINHSALFIKRTIELGELQSIWIKYFGTFVAKKVKNNKNGR